jgi:GNAT superfamily N-acetyltransferase
MLFDKKDLKFKVEYPTELLDTYRINILYFGLLIAYIDFTEIYNGYYRFENDFSEEEFEEIIKSDDYIYIEQIYVDKLYRNKGIANKLMENFLIFCNKKLNHFDTIILNAYPLELSIPLDLLMEFYKKFGFYPIGELHFGNNCTMIKQINN